MAAFWATHRNINGFVAYHTYSAVFLRPYSTHPDTQFPTHDLEVFKNHQGARATELTGYPAVSVFHNFAYDPKEPMHGAMDDYAYDYYGWFGFTCELWDAPTEAGVDMNLDWINWTKRHPEEDDIKIMKWNDEKLDGKGFEPWHWFDHPQLGRVEIGGWDHKYVWQNAPTQYLPAICEKQVQFTVAQALMSPRLEFLKTNVEPLGDGVHKNQRRSRQHRFPPHVHQHQSPGAQSRAPHRGHSRAARRRHPGQRQSPLRRRPARRSYQQNLRRVVCLPLNHRQPEAPRMGSQRSHRRHCPHNSPQRSRRPLTTDLQLGEKQKKSPRRSRKS